MKIALFDMINWNKKNVTSLLKGHTMHMFDYSVTEEDLSQVSDAEALLIFMSSKVDRKILDAFPRLKIICTMSTGYDHIDLEACRERGITVCNVPNYGQHTVAEYAFALILSMCRKIPRTIHQTWEENFSRDGLIGHDLGGKVLGVIGAGHIGLHAVNIGNGFGMEVIVSDVNRSEELAKKYGFQYASLDELLSKSDYITIHVPYHKGTHHLLSNDNMGKIKKGAFLVNTARGPVIESRALLEALDEGILAGVGLDVLENEEMMGKPAKDKEHREMIEINEALLDNDRVLITPHNAFNTYEALGRIEQTTVDNINKFIKGTPINTIK